MANQMNNICLLLLWLVAVTILCEVHLTFSLPHNRDSDIVSEGITGDVSHLRSKRSYWYQRKPLSNCRDKRRDCAKLINKRYPTFYCSMYKGQCDVTCGVAKCLGPITCRDLLSGLECYRAKLRVNLCRKRRYQEGCLSTCCSCQTSHPNCRN